MRLPVDWRNTASAGIQSIAHAIIKRDTTSNQHDCDQATGNCYTSGDTETLPIVLGTVIPLSAAILVLIYLHRRNKKKLRIEDANDPHKSLDFGLDGVPSNAAKGRKAGAPEMAANNNDKSKKTRGLSIDMMGVGSPYLLPAGLQGSRESLRSMSRSISDEHDPYRPVTMGLHSDSDSIRSGRNNLRGEQGSLYSTSTGKNTTNEKASLVANARPMSQTFGRRGDSRSPQDSMVSDDMPPPPQISRKPPPRKQSLASSEQNTPPVGDKDLPLPPEPVARGMPPRISSRRESQSTVHTAKRRSSVYAGDSAAIPAVPSAAMPSALGITSDAPYDIRPSMIFTTPEEAERASGPVLHAPQPISAQRLSMIGGNSRLSVVGGNNRLSVMGVRPLPPDEPDENPEVRANRIRSFYREYFDDSKPNPANGQYEEDVDPAFLDAAAVFDPDTGRFVVPGSRPFAQGPGRRAMTPPARGPPRVSGQSNMHQRKFSTMSTGRNGPRGRQAPPKKKLPPPTALTSLPTPHLLKEDAVVFNVLDFAPPSTFRNMQNGSRPDSPAGTPRPYSPSVRAFTPLASSFDNLTVMPSPHELRKSTTFTGLDFAPPSRIRDPGNLSPSDAGSIRSNRSGISAVQTDAIRQGAYRVSRIPKEMVSTKEDWKSQLKPRMDLVERA